MKVSAKGVTSVLPGRLAVSIGQQILLPSQRKELKWSMTDREKGFSDNNFLTYLQFVGLTHCPLNPFGKLQGKSKNVNVCLKKCIKFYRVILYLLAPSIL